MVFPAIFCWIWRMVSGRWLWPIKVWKKFIMMACQNWFSENVRQPVQRLRKSSNLATIKSFGILTKVRFLCISSFQVICFIWRIRPRSEWIVRFGLFIKVEMAKRESLLRSVISRKSLTGKSGLSLGWLLWLLLVLFMLWSIYLCGLRWSFIDWPLARWKASKIELGNGGTF